MIKNPDEYSTDLMKCLESLKELEQGGQVRTGLIPRGARTNCTRNRCTTYSCLVGCLVDWTRQCTLYTICTNYATREGVSSPSLMITLDGYSMPYVHSLGEYALY